MNQEMLLSESVLRESADLLLLNAYSVEKQDIAEGKAGIAVSLFVLARFFQDERLENHAFDLLSEVLALPPAPVTFENGKAGIAFALHYLSENGLLNVDYREVY